MNTQKHENAAAAKMFFLVGNGEGGRDVGRALLKIDPRICMRRIKLIGRLLREDDVR